MAKRKTVKERTIEAPVLALRVQDEVRLLKSEPEWKSGAEDGITLVKYPHMRIVLFALRKGIRMREHTVEGPMSLYVVSGNVTLVVGKERFQLRHGGLFTLRKSVPHDVQANTDSELLLTIMRL